jgi:glutamine amidotransferase
MCWLIPRGLSRNARRMRGIRGLPRGKYLLFPLLLPNGKNGGYMIAIVDYGVGNLFSLCSSLKYIGQNAVIASDKATINRSDKILLPGVGAFADAAAKLRGSGLYDVVISETRNGKPLLGVCLGMQMLFDKSLEFGEHEGLGLLRGVVAPIKPLIPANYKVPHIGWNALKFPAGEKSQLFKYTDEGAHVYFVHSFHAEQCDGSVIATTEYGADLTAAVGLGNVFGTQFHPEKSGDAGLDILKAFADM